MGKGLGLIPSTTKKKKEKKNQTNKAKKGKPSRKTPVSAVSQNNQLEIINSPKISTWE
jgi:hypothetical protein